MMKMRKTIVEGLELKTEIPSFSNNHDNPVLRFIGTSGNIPITSRMLSQHILLTGGIGMGKTNAMFQMVDQIIKSFTNEDVMVVFDSKGDFLKEFGPKIKNKAILSNGPESTVNWNMINETLMDGPEDVDDNIMELANSLFGDMISKDSSNPFFTLASKNVFYGILTGLYNKYKKDHKLKSNRYINNGLIYNTTKLDVDSIANLFKDPSCKRYTKQLLEYLGEMNNGEFEITETGSSVLATMRNVVIDVFKGNFAKEGDFSIREFVRKKNGAVLFIEYDLSQGRVLSPIYKTLVDLAIKESLCRNHSKGNVYFVMDEFRLLPKLNLMDSGVNLGRSLGAKFIVAMQNVEQIVSIYGESEAKSILSGFITNVNFRTTDMQTREMTKNQFGKCRFSYEVQSLSAGRQYEVDDVVTDSDILKLEMGEAIISVPVLDKNPIKFKFKEYRGR